MRLVFLSTPDVICSERYPSRQSVENQPVVRENHWFSTPGKIIGNYVENLVNHQVLA
jgi:hypothetical protein